MQLRIPLVVFALFTVSATPSLDSAAFAGYDKSLISNGVRVDVSDDDRSEDAMRRSLTDSISLMRGEMEQLQSVIERGTFGIGSYYFSNLRSWVIPSAYAFNDTLAQYFFEVSENDSTYIQQRGDIQVFSTTGDTIDLVTMLFTGNDQEKKGWRLHELLHALPERNMYARVLMSGTYGEERLLVDHKFYVANQLQPRLMKNSDFILSNFTRIESGPPIEDMTTKVFLRIPDRAHLQIGPYWGVEWKLGNEEVGYPFWVSGNMSVSATYERIKLGMQFPFAGGKNLTGSIGTILPRRTLDGTFGARMEFDAGFAGGSFMIGFRRIDPDGSFVDPHDIYSIRSAAQLWYSYTFAIGPERITNLFRLKIGLGFHQIGHDRLVPGATVIKGGVQTTTADEVLPTGPSRSFVGPYLNFDFVNQQFSQRFGASFQYYNEWGMTTAWLELLRDVLRLELKGAVALLRERQQWEPSYFVMMYVPFIFSL